MIYCVNLVETFRYHFIKSMKIEYLHHGVRGMHEKSDENFVKFTIQAMLVNFSDMFYIERSAQFVLISPIHSVSLFEN